MRARCCVRCEKITFFAEIVADKDFTKENKYSKENSLYEIAGGKEKIFKNLIASQTVGHMSTENGKAHETTKASTNSRPSSNKKESQVTTNATSANPSTSANSSYPSTSANSSYRSTSASSSTATNGLVRLAPVRDLTLGGRDGVGNGGNMKKVFVPNLNVVRNKNSNVKTSKDLTAVRGRGSGRGSRGSQRGGGGRGGNSSLIQTTGLFSEGAGAVHVRRNFNTQDRANDEPSISQLRKPIITKSSQKINVKEELASLNEILCSDDDNDEESLEEENEQTPVQLREEPGKVTKQQKHMVANLINPESDDPLVIAQHLQNLHVQQQQRVEMEVPPKRTVYPSSVEAFLEKTEPQLFIMQIPERLPCICDDEDEKAVDDKSKIIKLEPGGFGNSNDINNLLSTIEQNATNSSSSSNKQKHSELKDMDEGQVGKLVRYKSGKTKLILGETQFDMSMGMEAGFLQELMSITTNREERSGNMVNLGPIQAKFNLSPDWEHLFEKHENKSTNRNGTRHS